MEPGKANALVRKTTEPAEGEFIPATACGKGLVRQATEIWETENQKPPCARKGKALARQATEPLDSPVSEKLVIRLRLH